MKTWWVALAALIAFSGPVAPAFAQGGERVEAGAIGISIVTPQGWILAPPGTVTRSLLSLDNQSPEFRKALETNGLEPLITIAKYPARDGSSVPVVKIQYMAFPLSMSLIDLSARSIVPLQRQYTDVVVLDPPALVTLAGMPAGFRRVSFSAVRDGVSYPTISEVWIIRRGDFLFLIGANYDPAVSDQTKVEVHAAIASIVIRPE